MTAKECGSSGEKQTGKEIFRRSNPQNLGVWAWMGVNTERKESQQATPQKLPTCIGLDLSRKSPRNRRKTRAVWSHKNQRKKTSISRRKEWSVGSNTEEKNEA